MSRHSSPLASFLATLTPSSSFPKNKLSQYLNRSSPSKIDCLSTLKTATSSFVHDYFKWKEVLVAVWVCVVKNIEEGIIEGISAIQALMRSRMLMIVFDLEGKFVLHQVMGFIEEPIEVVVRKALENGMEGRLMEIIRNSNKSKVKFNEILFLIELLLVRKIQKNLDYPSLQQFSQFLKQAMSESKYSRVNQTTDTMRFRLTALLRQNQQSYDTFQLQMKDGRLIKQPAMTRLPPWVVEAHVKSPKPIDRGLFRSKKVLDILALLQQAQIYASSPLIEDLQGLIEDEEFNEIFQSFLMGQPLGIGQYQFGCQRAKSAIESIKERLAKQNEVYRQAVVREARQWTQSS